MSENKKNKVDNIRNEPIFDQLDAVHYYFRQTYPLEIVLCLSCNATFESISIMEIFEHYYYLRHRKSCGDCLYCGGNVYEYKIRNEIKKFHNCSRWRRGLE